MSAVQVVLGLDLTFVAFALVLVVILFMGLIFIYFLKTFQN